MRRTGLALLLFVGAVLPAASGLLHGGGSLGMGHVVAVGRCRNPMMGVSRKRRKQEVAAAELPKDDEPGAKGLREPSSADADVLLSTSSETAESANAAAATKAQPGCEPVFALESAELLSSVRVGSLANAPTYDAVRDALMKVSSGESITTFVQANRDLLDYRFLYQLTAETLRAENTGRAQEATVLREARAEAVRATQQFDAPLFKQVAEAESRLGGLLAQYMQGKAPEPAAVVAAAGSSSEAIFAFWMVVLAAVTAWEVKLPIASIEPQARQKLAELADIRSALEGDDKLMQTAGIRPLDALAALSDASSEWRDPAQKAKARDLLLNADSDPQQQLAAVRRIGCTYCQAQRHGFQAYNPVVQRMAALYDVLLYGEVQPLVACDIAAPPRAPSSKMVEVANDSEQIIRDSGLDIPLFW
jgi:hypothetical protein